MTLFHEAELVVADVELLGQFLGAGGRVDAARQHHQVGGDLHLLAQQRVGAAHHDFAVIFVQLGDTATHVLDAELGLDPS